MTPAVQAPIGRPKPTTFGLTTPEWGIALTSVALNVLVNGVLPARAHIAASLAASGVVAALAKRAGAGAADQGLAPSRLPAGVVYGAAAATCCATAVSVAMSSRRTREMFREPRIEEVPIIRALYEVGVRIPLGTAFPEEMIFRGALLGLLAERHGAALSVALSSFLFGLWHIAPTLDRIEGNPHARSQPASSKAVRVAASVAATTAAGVALAWLRRRSGSLVAPWMAHSAVNGTGFAAAWVLARASDRMTPLAPAPTTD